MAYTPQHPIRMVTSTSLFDGHDASINIMRRIFQSKGVEIIHLGHNRSVREIVECAIQEDVQGIAVTSYQGGHLEFFKYMKDLLDEWGCGHIKIFGGGGGTILPTEIEQLHQYGITRLYSPDDGRKMGLEGMIEDVIQHCDFALPDIDPTLPASENRGAVKKLARLISMAEKGTLQGTIPSVDRIIPVIGITGTGGAGKSSVTDELVRRFLLQTTDKKLAIISVDPSRKKTGGALLGDRIRMNAIDHPHIFMRSMATRNDNKALSSHVPQAVALCKQAGFDAIIVESAGVGQSDASIVEGSDVSIYVMTPEYGAATQLEKINMLDFADLIAINKFDKPGAEDALRDVSRQYRRNHQIWDEEADIPVVGTIAAQFNDAGVDELFVRLMLQVEKKTGIRLTSTAAASIPASSGMSRVQIIPAARTRYLSEITDTLATYDRQANEQATLASRLYRLEGARESLAESPAHTSAAAILQEKIEEHKRQLSPETTELISHWPSRVEQYAGAFLSYKVRGQEFRQPLQFTTLSGSTLSRVVLPRFSDWGDIVRWQMQENLPGHFPFTAGVFELKRKDEDPTRMFAGEGPPERTNKRFHYLSQDQPAIRLSTAFDSVTLYGEDPAMRPDIYGKVGNSGVSIATLDDAKKLYSGFDLCDARTSVSMTINGPAPILLAFFLNAAIDQQCEQWITEHNQWERVEQWMRENIPEAARPIYSDTHQPGVLPEGNTGLGLRLLGTSGDKVLPKAVYDEIRARTLSLVRGTVQADILKEDQAQNTCIFSTEFALQLMGDVQVYFSEHQVRNFYSISISGYHIAEAGANPITQLAFTLANGFTYVEYFLSRGLSIDDFASNLSFFFSNGMDPEYSVIGRVARRIWAKAIRYKYKGNSRSQKLKYHIQTSGRSLHAQEIDFNDIRTTLQALYAIYDNCNSLHTNAYDEAITTPTEESVRRAMAIQLIINRELGTALTDNFIQGSYMLEALTDLVEKAVLAEFDRISERGGVLGAMERMYQRHKIQEESMYYETRKHSGELPIIGVNTFLSKKGSPTLIPDEVIRSTREEKEQQIANLHTFQQRNASLATAALKRLQEVALQNGNLFTELMETVKYCSLGQITAALYQVGGQYRRNM
ncbi:MAG: methylmalonyl-CoA mutase family protein [Bacteroidota bacterium]